MSLMYAKESAIMSILKDVEEDHKRTQARQALDRAHKLDPSSKVGKAAKAKLAELR